MPTMIGTEATKVTKCETEMETEKDNKREMEPECGAGDGDGVLLILPLLQYLQFRPLAKSHFLNSLKPVRT